MSFTTAVAPLPTTSVAQAVQDYAAMNQIMAKVCPELASEHAQFPVAATQWLSPSGKTPNGQPCFLPGSKTDPMIMDYVYSKHGPLGPGFYHLLTKQAYTALYGRLINGKAPTVLAFWKSSAKQDRCEYEWTKEIVRRRWEASRPNIAAGPQTARSDVVGLRKHGLLEQAKVAVPVPKGSVPQASDNIKSVC